MTATTAEVKTPPETSTSSQPNEQIELSTLDGQSKHHRLEQQIEVSNATSAITPVELTRSVRLKLFSAAFCFFNAGINDGSLGGEQGSSFQDVH